jgi:hypothetical protein
MTVVRLKIFILLAFLMFEEHGLAATFILEFLRVLFHVGANVGM